jgi:hypothetical protein
MQKTENNGIPQTFTHDTQANYRTSLGTEAFSGVQKVPGSEHAPCLGVVEKKKNENRVKYVNSETDPHGDSEFQRRFIRVDSDWRISSASEVQSGMW